MSSVSVNADFSEKQVRYLSYHDVTQYLKKLKVHDHECYRNQSSNYVIFGYSSPVTGQPVSSNPNFDFLNSFISCLKSYGFKPDFSKYLDSDLMSQVGSIYNRLGGVKAEDLNKAIDQLIVKLIGPEIVLVSYGFIGSQKELRDLLSSTAMNIVSKESDPTIESFLSNVFVLIHLRDEFLSY
jgi:hypothetical protein